MYIWQESTETKDLLVWRNNFAISKNSLNTTNGREMLSEIAKEIKCRMPLEKIEIIIILYYSTFKLIALLIGKMGPTSSSVNGLVDGVSLVVERVSPAVPSLRVISGLFELDKARYSAN